jgi:glycosyltransferase involved in cell wall biosynthesis
MIVRPARPQDPGDRETPQERAGIPGFGRVLHVLNGLSFGGNETLCLQLMTRLPTDERLVLNIGPDGAMRQKLESLPGFHLFELEYRREHRLLFVWELTRFLRRLRPAGVIVYPFGLHLLVALAARLAGVRRILVHAGNPVPVAPRWRRLWRWIVRASVLLGTPIISCSAYVDQEFRRLSRLMPAGSRTILNGIDTLALGNRASAARVQRTDRRPTVAMVARLSAIKDQETLIRSMAFVRVQHPEVQLWIVGEGEMGTHLEQVTTELELQDVVRFLGKRGDVPELLGQVDVYVFSTTRDEGFGIAIGEAMSARLPVVATDVPACREVLDHEAGILVPPGDPLAMGAAVSRLLSEPLERERWAARALDGTDLFSLERCAREWQLSLTGAP